MGRPSHKRPRKLLIATSQKHVVTKHPPPVSAMFDVGSSLGSLLFASRSYTDFMSRNITTRVGTGTAQVSRLDTEAPALQNVWGAMSEADIVDGGSGLRLGVDVDVDRFGVVWLLNPESNRTTTSEHNSTNGIARCTTTRPENGSVDDAANTINAATAGGSPSPPLMAEVNAEGLEKKLPVVSGVVACDEALREELRTLKGEFGDIPPTVFKRARSACNPAEAIGSGPFLNRSAVKLANIDAIAGLLPLSPPGLSASISSFSPQTLSDTPLADTCRRKEPARQRQDAASASFNSGDGDVGRLPCRNHDDGSGLSRGEAYEGHGGDRERVRREDDKDGEKAGTLERSPLFLFADLCGGPGGFSEYILRRRRCLGLPAKGWGISLAEDNSEEPDNSHCHRAIGDERCETSEWEVCPAKQGGRVVLSDDPGDGRVCSRDPCAWRIDRLTPWCEVSVTRGCRSVVLVQGAEHGAATADASRERDAGGAFMTRIGVNPGKDAPQKEGSRAEVIDGVASQAQSYLCSPAGNRGHGNTPRSIGTSPDDGNTCRERDTSEQDRGKASSTVDLDKGGTSPPPVAPSPASPAPIFSTKTAAGDARPLLKMRIDYGPDGTGNLASESNIRGFVDSVLASTGGERLDLVVSDGGFGAARNARDQESLVSPLVHCEALTALLLLAEGGSFMCKLFEVWTEPTATLVYLLHRMFRRIAIIKPITSRPASGERYLVCTGLLARSRTCRFTRYLHAKVHELLQCTPLHSAADECLESLSASADGTGGGSGGIGALDIAAEMKQESGFLTYLRLVNDRLARVQMDACARIADVCSSERGRAWVFRGGKGTRSVARHSGGKGIDVEDEEGSDGDGDGDTAVLKLFVDAWCLRGLGAADSDDER